MKPSAVATVFVELADALVDSVDVGDVLQVLVDRCVDVLGTSAAGVLVADRTGVLQLVASSTERARLLELYQLQTAEGPCLDAYRTGRLVSIRDVQAGQKRWPRFAPAAVAAGYRSAQSLPMRVRGQTIGALNLFHAEPCAETDAGLCAEEIAVAQALADVASVAIMQTRTAQQSAELTEQLQTALDSRVVIEQAKGMIAVGLNVNPEQAFDLLRSTARRTRRPLFELAREVVSERIPTDSLRAGR